MDLTQHVATDLVQELRLRRWARENYVPVEFRDPSWHPAVLDEMQRKEQELNAESSFCDVARRIVPLVPERGPTLHGPHNDFVGTRVLARIPCVEQVAM
jgi:hypothetical protein